MSEQTPESPFTSLMASATACHEMYLSFLTAGFTPDQAIYLVGEVIKGSMK